MKLSRIHRSDPRKKGIALAVMVFAVVGLAALSAGLMYVNLRRTTEQREQKEQISADYVCQAGLSQAMYRVRQGFGGNVGTPNQPMPWGHSQFWVQQTDVTPEIFTLTSTGVDDRTGARQELTMREVPNTIWEYGAFGREFLHLDSNARVDSYNSTLGTYASQAVNGAGSNQYASLNGDIGSNGDISLDQNAQVWGDSLAGPGHTTTILGNAEVTGTTTPSTDIVTFPVIAVPNLTSLGNLTVTSNTTMAAGAYRWDTMRVNSSKTLTLTGPSTIVCTNMEMKSNSAIIVNATNGPVTFYVIDDFIMESNATIHSTTYEPIDVRMYLLSDNVITPEVNIELDQVVLNSNTSIYGTVFAPNARIILYSNFSMFGAMMARSLEVYSDAFFHFDEALINATANENPFYEMLCWRELPYQG